MIIKFLTKIISLYAHYISPLLGNRCRFHPSCSCYAKDALAEHGVIKGVILAISRILRCNPLFKGGFDPVPTNRLK